MVRSKVKYEFIADECKRRVAFKKRKSDLFKKLKEMKTLCNVEACGIITDGEGIHTDVWPSPYEGTQLMEKFVAMSTSSSSNTTSGVDQMGFLTKYFSRITRNSDKETQKIRYLEKELILAMCLEKGEPVLGSSLELHDDVLLRVLEGKMGMVNIKIGSVEPGIVEGTSRLSSREKGKQVI